MCIRDSYCSKGDINVGGENATRVQETCCTDFTERTTQVAKSSMGSASQKINVACEACHLSLIHIYKYSFRFEGHSVYGSDVRRPEMCIRDRHKSTSEAGENAQ